MRKSDGIFDSFQFTYEQILSFDLEKSHHPFEIYINDFYVTVLSLRLSFLPSLKKSYLHTLLTSTLIDYTINYLIPYVTS